MRPALESQIPANLLNLLCLVNIIGCVHSLLYWGDRGRLSLFPLCTPSTLVVVGTLWKLNDLLPSTSPSSPPLHSVTITLIFNFITWPILTILLALAYTLTNTVWPM